MNIIIDLENYSRQASVFKRAAARAIIAIGDQYLLIFSKYGDCKFPGGGVEKDEDLEDTLVREVQEETGYRVLMESIRKYGKVLEIRKGEYGDRMEMESTYFFCHVDPDIGDRNLDHYEEQYEYSVKWMTLSEAIEKNKRIDDLEVCPWVTRDTAVMERLVKEQSR